MWTRRIRYWFERSKREQALETEMREHLEELVLKLREQGLSEGRARQEAQRRFGNSLQKREDSREVWLTRWLSDFTADVRLALRQIRRSPGFAILAIITLGLGIGAATATFAIVDKVLLKKLPYDNADRLVSVWATVREWRNDPTLGKFWDQFDLTYTQYQALQATGSPFERVAIFSAGRTSVLRGVVEPVRVPVAYASADLFSMLGIHPVRGRVFDAADEHSGTVRPVAISESMWRTFFGGASDILGRKLTLDIPYDVGQTSEFVIVGVLPRTFQLFGSGMDASQVPDIWIPIRPADRFFERDSPDYETLGILRKGETLSAAEPATESLLTASLGGPFMQMSGLKAVGAHIVRRQEQESHDVRQPSLILFGATALLLLIACGNVANLLLGRAATRTHEIALRLAIGAGRFRLIRQLITESLVLSFIGGATGIVLGGRALRILVRFMPQQLPRANEIAVDYRVALAALAACVANGLLFGLLPAWTCIRAGLDAKLKLGGRTATNPGMVLLGGVTAAEIALSFVLLAIAALLTQSFWRLNAVAPGIRADNLITAQFRIDDRQYRTPESRATFYNTLRSRLQTLPGVTDVSVIPMAPFSDQHSVSLLEVEGQTGPILKQAIERREVPSNYFSVVGTSILAGRGFTNDDVRAAAPIGVVSRGMAQRFWPNQNAIGKRFRTPDPPHPWITIIGIVEDVKFFGLRSGDVEMFYTPSSAPDTDMTILIRANNDGSALLTGIRATIREVAPNLPISRLETMRDLMALTSAPERYRATLIVTFAVIAATLTLIGLFGVVCHFAKSRSREIAIRIALGARPANVKRLVLRHSAVCIVMGLAVGVAIASVCAQFLSSYLFDITPTDHLTYATIAISLTTVALGASYLPARQASKTDPLVILHRD